MGNSDSTLATSGLTSPNTWGLAFHHLGLAARDPEAAALFLTGLGYRIGPIIIDPLQNVRARLCVHDQMPDVEILSPADSPGPLDKLLSAHKDGLIYHMCYTCVDLDRSLDALEGDERFRVHPISPPTEGVMFGGRRVSFYLVEGVGLIEIIEDGR